MNQEPFSLSHRAVKILEESVREFVNDLGWKKISLNKTKKIEIPK